MTSTSTNFEQIQQIIKKVEPLTNSSNLIKMLNVLLPKLSDYNLDNNLSFAHFISQILVESARLNATAEYANGSAYEGRKDLGNIYKGDGMKYKGRGVIQITGRSNYTLLSKDLLGNDNLVDNPSLLENYPYALTSALWFWQKNKINDLIKPINETVSYKIYYRKNGQLKSYYKNIPSYEAVTRKINGGVNHLTERKNYFFKIYDILENTNVFQKKTPNNNIILALLGFLMLK